MENQPVPMPTAPQVPPTAPTGMSMSPVPGKKMDKTSVAILIGAAAAVVVALAIVLVLVFGGGGYEKALDRYVSLVTKGDASQLEKAAPQAYWDYLFGKSNYDTEDLIETYKDRWEQLEKAAPQAYWDYLFGKSNYDTEDLIETYKDRLEQREEYWEEEYGDHLRISYTIDKEKDLTEKKLDTLRDNLKDRYGIAKKAVTEGKQVTVTLKIEGSEDEDEVDYTLYVIKIDGDWFVCNESGYFNLL